MRMVMDAPPSPQRPAWYTSMTPPLFLPPTPTWSRAQQGEGSVENGAMGPHCGRAGTRPALWYNSWASHDWPKCRGHLRTPVERGQQRGAPCGRLPRFGSIAPCSMGVQGGGGCTWIISQGENFATSLKHENFRRNEPPMKSPPPCSAAVQTPLSDHRGRSGSTRAPRL